MLSDKVWNLYSIQDEKLINTVIIQRRNCNLPVMILDKKKEIAFNINKYTVVLYSMESGDLIKEIEDPRRSNSHDVI